MSTNADKCFKEDIVSDGELLDCEETPVSDCLTEDRPLSLVEGDAVLISDDEGELDYVEMMDTDHRSEIQVKDSTTEDEDEVKVHATGDIEEGEISSDEEGEIKESEEDSDARGSKLKQKAQKTAAVMKLETQSSDGEDKTPSRVLESPATPPRAPIDKVPKSPCSEESEQSHDEESHDSDKDIIKTRNYQAPLPKRSKVTVNKIPTLCRHFANGKCSWGDECRFLHTNPVEESSINFHPSVGKLPPHERLDMPPQYPGPPHVHRGAPHMRGPPRGFPSRSMRGFHPGFPPRPPHIGNPHDLPPHMGPIHHEVVRPHGFAPRRGPPPPPEIFKGPGNSPPPPLGSTKTAEVAEESVGWYRLRTITEEWNSDQESEKKELDVLKRKKPDKGSESENEGTKMTKPEEWTDPWDRQTKKDIAKPKKKKKKVDKDNSKLSDGESDSDSEKARQTKSLAKKHAPPRSHKRPQVTVPSSHSSSHNSSSESESETKQRKLDKSKLSKAAKKERRGGDGSSGNDEVDITRKTRHKSSKIRKLLKDSVSDEKKKKKNTRTKRHHSNDLPSSVDDAKCMYDPTYAPPPFPPGPGRDEWHHPPHGHPTYVEPYPPHPPHPPHPPSHYGPAYSHRGNFSPHNPGWRQIHEREPHYYPSQYFANRGRPSVGPDARLPISLQGFDSQQRVKQQKEMQRRGSSESGSHSPTPAAESYSSSTETSPERSQHRKSSHQTDSPSSEKGSRHESKGKGDKLKKVSRREKLLQELHAIDKNIERKKSKKGQAH